MVGGGLLASKALLVVGTASCRGGCGLSEIEGRGWFSGQFFVCWIRDALRERFAGTLCGMRCGMDVRFVSVCMLQVLLRESHGLSAVFLLSRWCLVGCMYRRMYRKIYTVLTDGKLWDLLAGKKVLKVPSSAAVDKVDISLQTRNLDISWAWKRPKSPKPRRPATVSYTSPSDRKHRGRGRYYVH